MTSIEYINMFQEALNEVVPGRSGDFENVRLDTHIDDLSVDSVTFMELIGVVEERVGITFADDQLARVATFQDIANLIQA